jgi:hypothetical protein
MRENSRLEVVRFAVKTQRLPGRILRMAGAMLALLLTSNAAQAAFHLWGVTEIYSSADGSVQYVKLSTASTFQSAMAGHVVTCVAPSGVSNTFTFPANLSTSSTANRSLLIGTSKLATVPGGVTPDFVLTNTAPFLFVNGNAANSVFIVGTLTAHADYTNLPTDGEFALSGSGASFVATVNSPENFNGQSNRIVPVKFLSGSQVGTNFVMTFRTATGVNGAAGPTYGVQYKNSLSDPSWTPLASVGGDGTTKSVSNALSSATQRFFRLNVP